MERSVFPKRMPNYKDLKESPPQKGRALQRTVKKPLGKTNCYVIGVGGGGNNTVNRLKSTAIRDALCICINTDLQHLNAVRCDISLLIGKKTTRGLGSGGKPELGQAAAEESYADIQRVIADADIVFLTCGLGGGTGTGSMPIIAEIAKNSGAIVIGVVTIPFTIEGARKGRAYIGLEKLRKNADTVVVIDNDKLLDLVPDLPIEEAFSVADEVLANYIYSIITTVSQPGLINVDFADLKTIITKGGVTVCGVGEANGEDRAIKALETALENPLIDVNYNSGTAALIHVTGGATMSLNEASGVVKIIQEKLQPGAEVIWGTKVDPELDDVLRVTIVISGVQSNQIIGMRKTPSLGFSSSVAGVVGNSAARTGQQIPRVKENWLKRESIPLFKEFRKKAKETKSQTKEKRKREGTEEFWNELGLSKGLE